MGTALPADVPGVALAIRHPAERPDARPHGRHAEGPRVAEDSGMLSLRALPTASQVPGFRLLWVSLSSTGLGTAISQVALTWTMLELTGSPFMVGAALAARLAPFLVFGLPLGALSDRVDRRRLIVWADVAGAALAMLVAVLAFAGEIGVAAILVLSFALGRSIPPG